MGPAKIARCQLAAGDYGARFDMPEHDSDHLALDNLAAEMFPS